MKKAILLSVIVTTLLGSVCCYASILCFPIRDAICKENKKEICQDYDSFVDKLFNNRNWQVSVNLLRSYIPNYKIQEGESKKILLWIIFMNRFLIKKEGKVTLLYPQNYL